MAKQKFYVVWNGRKTGIFDNWEECRKQIEGFTGAVYKSFDTKEIALEAFTGKSEDYIGKNSLKSELTPEELKRIGNPILESVCVDGAWDTSTGLIEYQGVYTKSKQKLFKQGPYNDGTNNIAEFLAIVHALAYCKAANNSFPIYSDSKNAISWVKAKKARTKLIPTSRNATLFELISRAEKWLIQNEYTNQILKWETKAWGENLADFGRK